jgi:hypothetical protein
VVGPLGGRAKWKEVKPLNGIQGPQNLPLSVFHSLAITR